MRSFRLLVVLGAVGLLSAVAAYLAVSYVRGLRQENAVAAYADEIFRSPTSFVAGNPRGDVSVVAFLDYNCPYCREDAADLKKLLSEDGKVRLVIKELPVLGPDSEDVARIAQASIAQGKYLQLHDRLFSERGRATKAKALGIAAELGLDTAKLEADMRGPAVEAAIAANKLLADRLEVEGVPFYLVGDRRLPGSDDDLYVELSTGVADVRQHGCLAQC